MGLIRAAADAVKGTLADQWVDYFTAPVFDEQTVVAPGVLTTTNRGRGTNSHASANIISDGSRIVVPENTALIITDGGRIISASTEPGYFTFYNDGQPSVFTGSSVREALVTQSWERFKFGGEPGQQQLIYFINLREIRSIRFGIPGPLPFRDFSLVPPGSTQAPVLRLRARGQYSIRVADPIRFFRNFLPANAKSCSLTDAATATQLTQEFITAFQAALQSLSRTTDIASLATHGAEVAATLSEGIGAENSWLQRFGLEVVSVAISTIEYDDESRQLMDKYNKGAMLGGSVGNAYTQTTVADAALAIGENGGGGEGLVGLALGLGSIGGTLAGMTQPTTPPGVRATPDTDPVAVLGELKAMLEQGLITAEQYAAKQSEILDRM